MQVTDFETHVGEFVKLCEKAPLVDRQNLKPEVERVIRTIKSHHLAVPGPLRRLKESLEDEAFDDMFDNMPV